MYRSLLDEPALDAYACYVAEEIFMLARQPQKAVEAWSGVLQAHKRSPAPQAASRAAWMLARLARESGHALRERKALELALQTAAGAEPNVALVEQIALALASGSCQRF